MRDIPHIFWVIMVLVSLLTGVFPSTLGQHTFIGGYEPVWYYVLQLMSSYSLRKVSSNHLIILLQAERILVFSILKNNFQKRSAWAIFFLKFKTQPFRDVQCTVQTTRYFYLIGPQSQIEQQLPHFLQLCITYNVINLKSRMH